MRRLSTDGVRLGIVNPLTLVGNEVKTLLHERGVPYKKVELYHSGETKETTLTEVDEQAAVVMPLEAGCLDGLDIVFFCGPGEPLRDWMFEAGEKGYLAIDLTTPSSTDHQTAPVVAGINDDQLLAGGQIVVSPHPIAVPIALILHAIRTKFAIRLCAAAAVQPASEFDQLGVDELYQQTLAALNMQSMPKKVFDQQLAFNIYPAAEAAAIEHSIALHLRSVLGPIPISVSVTQGTTFHGHSLSLFVQVEGVTSEAELRALLEQSPSISLANEDDTYSTLDAAGKDQVLIGRVQQDRNLPNSFWIWAVSDNLRRGSALNAVMIAEEVIGRVVTM